MKIRYRIITTERGKFRAEQERWGYWHDLYRFIHCDEEYPVDYDTEKQAENAIKWYHQSLTKPEFVPETIKEIELG